MKELRDFLLSLADEATEENNSSSDKAKLIT